MATIITREVGATAKGTPLTNAELDNNFVNINNELATKANTNNPTFTGTVALSSLAITTNTTPAVFTKDDNLTAWEYSGKSFSVNAQETNPTGIFFKPDGLMMYIAGQTGDDITQYSLSVAWDVTTATFVQTSAAVGETAPGGVFFKPDGLAMYVVGSTNDSVREFSLSVAWDVSTIAFVREFSVAAEETGPADLWFKPDGTKMYVVGSTGDDVNEYNLTTAWNVSTAVFVQSFSVAAQDSLPASVMFNPDGTKMYVLGTTGQDINRYSLSVAWDISTAVFFNTFYVGFQEVTPNGLFINFDSNTAYVVGTSSDTVFQYATLTDGVELASGSGLFIDGSLYTNKNLVVTSGTRIDGLLNLSGAATLSSTLTVGSTATLNGAVTMPTTTGNITIGTSQSTGTTTIGGTAQTGSITVGRSTGTQILDLAVGATTVVATKTVNIGTAGVSGSTTNINIGSAVSGSLGTTTLNSRLTTPFQITSTLATGTAPLVVESTTRVANLNVATAGVADTVTNGVYTTGDQAIAGTKTFSNTLTSTGILKAAQILQGTNTFVRDYASGYSTTVAASTLYEIGRLTFTGINQNVAIVGEIRGGSGSLVGVNRFILTIRADSPLSSKTFTLFEEETTDLGRVINIRVYHDTTSGLVVIGYTTNSTLQNIGWSLRVQERADYNYLQQTTALTTLSTAGLTEVTPTSTVRTISSSLTVPNGITANLTGNATNVTGVVALANGGSGQTTAQSAINAFAGAVTTGQYLRGDGTNVVMSAIQAADVPDLNAAKITSGTIDAARLPSYVDDVVEAADLASFPATGETGKIYVALDNNKTYRWSGSVYISFNSGAVDSVAGKTGIVTLVASDVGAQPAGNYVTIDTEQTITAAKVVSVSSTGNALRITQTGTGNALLVEDAGNPDSSPFVIDTDGNAVFGNTTTFEIISAQTGTAAATGLQYATIAGANNSTFAIGNFSTTGTTVSPVVVFAKSKSGTIGTQAILANGDRIGLLDFQGSDGTQFVRAARIEAHVDGIPGQTAGTFTVGLSYIILSTGTTDFTLIGAASNTVGVTFTATDIGTGTGTAILATGDMPGRLSFSTTADGARLPTEHVRITSAGKTGFATTVPAATVHVAGDTILSNVNVLGATYDNVFFSVAAQEGTPQDVFFSPDGTHMYIIGSSGDDINEYELSTPWLISSAVFVTSIVIGQAETSPVGFFFRADGKKLYVVGQANDTVFQYTLSAPWNIATLSYDSVFFSVLAQESAPTSISFKPDGLSMYILGATTSDSVYQYTLSTAWDVSTAVFLQSFNVTSQETLPAGLAFTDDGTRMVVCGTTGDDVNVYNLTTPWNVSTAQFVSSLSVAGQETAPNGVYIKPDGTKMYVVGSTTDAIYQYTVPSINIQLTGPVSAGSLAVQQDLNVYGNSSSYAASFISYTEGTFVVTGTAPKLSPTHGTIQTWTLTANSTPTAGTWANGQSLTLMIDDGTARTINWTSIGVTWKTGGGIAPLLNTTGFTVIQLWKVGDVIYGARVGDA